MADWEERWSRSRNRVYFYNRATGESVWEKPANVDIRPMNPDGAQGGQQQKEVRASHLLVKHRDSRRPSSWKEENITRTKEEALEILRAHRERIVSGQVTFEELASKESDCSSARAGGDLGFFGPGKMQGSFALQVGEISEPVDTASGVHIILRTA
ncbi:hypothetical protein HK102_000833 [Quaeritorhiza haematococci]|nr:hypothetical protein HK102_000833 [Quaeritorhiza haematococci]